MTESRVVKLIGLNVTGQHGREIGVVSDFSVESESWKLLGVEVKLNRSVLDELSLNHPWIGTQSVVVPIGEISGATDGLVLKCRLEDMTFTGGKLVESAFSSPTQPFSESNPASI